MTRAWLGTLTNCRPLTPNAKHQEPLVFQSHYLHRSALFKPRLPSLRNNTYTRAHTTTQWPAHPAPPSSTVAAPAARPRPSPRPSSSPAATARGASSVATTTAAVFQFRVPFSELTLWNWEDWDYFGRPDGAGNGQDVVIYTAWSTWPRGFNQRLQMCFAQPLRKSLIGLAL
jgi:hypothetical protein